MRLIIYIGAFIIFYLALLLVGPEPVQQLLWNILISIDQLINTLLLGNPDETLSERAGTYRVTEAAHWTLKVFAEIICFIPEIFDPGHCTDILTDPDTAKEVF